MNIATVDFETEKIEPRPFYPPRPVGVAIRHVNGDRKYLAWGHSVQNNCSVNEARTVLKSVYRSGCSVLFHNSAFDLDVGEVHLGLHPPSNVEDTLYLAFLNNPHEFNCELKALAHKYLGMPPVERDKLRDWIQANIPEARRKKKEWGAYIALAPGELVGSYAVGDIDRTYWLYVYMLKRVVQEGGMLEAYVREKKLTRITIDMERGGFKVSERKLKNDLPIFEKLNGSIDTSIRRILRVGADFNVNSAPQLADALVKRGKLDVIHKTETGLVSTKIIHLRSGCNDKKLVNLLSVQSVLDKYITSFLRPWLAQAELTDGRILPHFNQVRDRGPDGGRGARSGRYSSSDPNLQNISAGVEESKNKEVLLIVQKILRRVGVDFIGLRDYIVPDDGMILMCHDYNQQELRLFAHFEAGLLMKAYLSNPRMDIHQYCKELVKRVTGMDFERKFIKITVFGIIYGMGLDKLAAQLEVDRETASKVKQGLLKAVPGISKLMRHLERLARHDEPLVTWGGRKYYCEEPIWFEKANKWISFEYKMLNYQVQPSAADVTKQGMIQVREACPKIRMAGQVHDELINMVPDKSYAKKIGEAMTDINCRVPMVVDVKSSRKSWARVV